MSELERLRQLLLGDELRSVAHIEAELQQLQERLEYPERLIEHIAPHFSKMLVDASTQEHAAFENAVVCALNTLVEHGSKASYEPVIKKISPLIYRELHNYTITHKEDVSDLLYPVVGGMISKYVSQMLQDMMNDINAKIQHGLSIQNIKRKIQAKVQGIDEAELLLYESLPVHVKAVLLIHKPMGAMIAHRVDKGNHINEPEMLGSMLTALTDFINNWIHQQEQFRDVNEINYGESKIHLESSGHSYLAVLLDGQTTQDVVTATNEVLTAILDHYATDIQEFDGDLSSMPVHEIETLFTPLFALNQHKPAKDQPPSKWPLAIIAFLLLTLGAWSYYTHYQKEHFQAMIATRIQNNPHLALYAISTSWQDNTLVIEGKVPNAKLNDELFNTLMTKKFPYDIDNRVLVLKPLEDYAKSKRLIAKQIAVLNSDPYTNLTYDVTNGTVTITGEATSPQRLQQVADIITELDAIKHLYINVTYTKSRHHSLYFKNGASDIDKEHAPLLERIAAHLEQYPQTHLGVIGYSSPSKNLLQNRRIAKKRAQNVTDALIALGVSPQRITTRWMAQPPLFHENNNSASQCVKFYWYNTVQESE